MSLIETRGHQMFPVFDAGQIETAKRFASGPAREFAPGDIVFEVGERQAPAWLVVKGSIDVVRRDGFAADVAPWCRVDREEALPKFRRRDEVGCRVGEDLSDVV